MSSSRVSTSEDEAERTLSADATEEDAPPAKHDGRPDAPAPGDVQDARDSAGTLAAAQSMSTWKAVCLVLTCTTAMILNVPGKLCARGVRCATDAHALPRSRRPPRRPSPSRASAATSPSRRTSCSGSSRPSRSRRCVPPPQRTRARSPAPQGCLLIFFGRLADLHGRKKAFLVGVAWLGVFSVGCGFARDAITLDVLRGIQGLGPAATIPASVSPPPSTPVCALTRAQLGILAHAFPPSRARSLAFATFSAGAPIGGAVGTQIGGILTQFAPCAAFSPPHALAADMSVRGAARRGARRSTSRRGSPRCASSAAR